MEAFLTFFEDMPSWQKLLWIFTCLSFNWIIEAVSPLFKFNYKKVKHIGVNMFFLASDLAINVLFTLATAGIMIWASSNQFGLLHLVHLPIWVELIISVMILDLVAQLSLIHI